MHPLASLPSEDGTMLWEVLYQAEYYDSDPRDSGTVPVDEKFYVLAKSMREALEKAKPIIEAATKSHHKKIRVTANIVTLENFIPARSRENDGRLGYFPSSALAEIKLSLEGDRQKFRLGVCLIPED